ncbi:hypothetical protein Pla123a_08530 [Posidoniimonas polymericola]|uniref:Uncharacterized protein n=1 Tax=Posidoniimonas polymericola TaxID=2528002 RepID=A0A5C5YST8_9BACT|nr:hypothetical protein [Posidoniimonas polymericola]TWT78064.1 hypothetical protein Pla123a_08530 [Posidoniimonas polymericola]
MDLSLTDLWLPILLSGVATHIASTVAWTVLPHHKPEFKGLGATEEKLVDLLQADQVGPGQYMLPYCNDMKEAGEPAFQEKQRRCTGMLSVYDRPVNMGAAIFKTLAFFLVAAFVIGYLASIGLPRGAASIDVLRFVTTAGLLAHCFARFPAVYWFPQKTAMSLLDGAAYAAVTGLLFTVLWPAAVGA